MIEIKDLLLGFSDILIKEEIKKGSIRDSIFEATGININTRDIKIKNGTVYLNTKPIYKNEIFFKKEEIKKSLQGKLRHRSPEDIR